MTRVHVPAPELSPDGHRVAVQLGIELVVADVTSATIFRLGSEDGVDALAFSPGGTFLAVLGAGRLAVFAVDSDGIRQHAIVDASPTAVHVSVDDDGMADTAVPADDEVDQRVDRPLPRADGHRVSPDGERVVWWSADGLGRRRELTIGVGATDSDAHDVVREDLSTAGEHLMVGVDDDGVVRTASGNIDGTVEVCVLVDSGLETSLILSASD